MALRVFSTTLRLSASTGRVASKSPASCYKLYQNGEINFTTSTGSVTYPTTICMATKSTGHHNLGLLVSYDRKVALRAFGENASCPKRFLPESRLQCKLYTPYNLHKEFAIAQGHFEPQTLRLPICIRNLHLNLEIVVSIIFHSIFSPCRNFRSES